MTTKCQAYLDLPAGAIFEFEGFGASQMRYKKIDDNSYRRLTHLEPFASHLIRPAQLISYFPAVRTIGELETLAKTDDRYLRLLHAAADNLGGPGKDDVDSNMNWLWANANEGAGEEGVVEEINFCRDLI